MRRPRTRRSLPEVELTPLVDVLFMLIVFFVLTAVFSGPVLPVKLPGGTGEEVPGESLRLSMDKNGGIFIGERKLSMDQAVEEALIHFGRGERIVIAADREVPYGAVVSLLDELKGAGVDSAGLLVESVVDQ
ncbi:MAG: TolR protein [Synergistales bacterium 58_81]|nr:MAG: TolR protein [Synergistales bacterium 58_81]